MLCGKKMDVEIPGKLAAFREGGGYIYPSDFPVPTEVGVEQHQHILNVGATK
jgi:hypothetical protein